jgi:hypothetical protein
MKFGRAHSDHILFVIFFSLTQIPVIGEKSDLFLAVKWNTIVTRSVSAQKKKKTQLEARTQYD